MRNCHLLIEFVSEMRFSARTVPDTISHAAGDQRGSRLPVQAGEIPAGNKTEHDRKGRNQHEKIVTLLLTVCLVLSLAACGGEKKQADEAEDQKTISGVVNQLGSYLVLLDSDGEYHIFDFGEDVDQSSLEEGDRVTVTYTGTLDNEDPSPVAVAVTETEG